MLTDLQKIPFFKDLTAAELTDVRRCLNERTFEKGEMIFLEGRPCDRIFFVRSGRVKIFRVSASGREQILESLDCGDTCACNPGEMKWDCSASAQAVTACTVWFLSREDYIKLVYTNIKLTRALNKLFAERLRGISSLVEEVSLKDARKRLVKFILDMVRDNPSQKGVLEISFTREEIAQRLGVVRETVVRRLNTLKTQGYIDIQPKKIIIKNVERLERLLDE